MFANFISLVFDTIPSSLLQDLAHSAGVKYMYLYVYGCPAGIFHFSNLGIRRTIS